MHKIGVIVLLVLVTSVGYGQLPVVSIELHPDSIAKLERDPFLGEDVYGDFIGSDGIRRVNVDLNYRGAYQLRTLIQNSSYRNWKVKVKKEERYLDRREWNYNFEDHPRQVLAYSLMQKAGVPAPDCHHVLFSVNNEKQQLYSEYEDPDNNHWLTDQFGDNDGDLFKAAYDIPGEPRFFAELNTLGDQNADYYQHYSKKTNHKNEGEGDYSSLISLIKIINETEEAIFVEELKSVFNTDVFIKLLVVSNFISNWDSYPVRPKNYWLYQNPADNRWTFIPWDLDATFQKNTTALNHMGSSASAFYQFDEYEAYDLQPQEGSERPLVRRMMKFGTFRNAYVDEYKKALSSYLNEEKIGVVLDSLVSSLENQITVSDFYFDEVEHIKSFLSIKTRIVINELDNYDYLSELKLSSIAVEESRFEFVLYPNPSKGNFLLTVNSVNPLFANITCVDISGRTNNALGSYILDKEKEAHIDLKHLSKGVYFLKIHNNKMSKTIKVVIK